MAVTGTLQQGTEPLLPQIEKIVASPILHGSDALCKLLRHLAQEAIRNPGQHIKEYAIATEVFGRPSDFDPKLDSTVRVQTGRLRAKLAEYYSTVGARDEVIVEIPKGAYLLTYRGRKALPDEAEPELISSSTTAGPSASAASPQKSFSPWLAIATLVLVIVSISALVGFARLRAPAANWQEMLHSVGLNDQDLPTLRRFWDGFTRPRDTPIVIYSNAEFTGRPETGMRYLKPGEARQDIFDHYTGVGEVAAMHELDTVFVALRSPLRVKRGRLLTFDDAQNSSLIFVGSPSENLSLRDLPIVQEFAFRRVPDASEVGDLTIVNLHPRNGEPLSFRASKGTPLKEDYAVISLLHNSRRNVMILAGTNTFGTQAAVDFVCDPDRLRELLPQIADGPDGQLWPFAAVLNVKISQGVPVQSQIVLLHHIKK